MHTPQSIHLFVSAYLSCFHILAVSNSAAVNMGVLISLQDLDCNSFWINSQCGIALLYGSLFLVFGGTSIQFSIVAAPFFILTNSVLAFQFLYILDRTCHFLIFYFLDKSHPDWCVIIYHWGFDLCFWSLVTLRFLSYTHWPSGCLIWRNVYSRLWPIF